MGKILSIIVLVLAIILFPPTTLALVSQNAIPGDATYPIKRKLEEIIITVASVNPKTKAWFSVDLSNRRFNESTALLAQGKNADATLGELVSQTTTAASEVNQLSDTSEKQKVTSDLNDDVGKFIVALAVEQAKHTANETDQNNQVTPNSSPVSTVQPTATPVSSSAPTSIPTPAVKPSSTPTPRPSNSPRPTPPPPSTDPKEICKNLPPDTDSLSQAIKKLCDIHDKTQPTLSSPKKEEDKGKRDKETPKPSQTPKSSKE